MLLCCKVGYPAAVNVMEGPEGSHVQHTGRCRMPGSTLMIMMPGSTLMIMMEEYKKRWPDITPPLKCYLKYHFDAL